VFVTWPHTVTSEDLGDGVVTVMRSLTSGVTARVTTMPDGWGPIRVEWTMGDRSYLLLTTHSLTDQVPTGVPTKELLAMAGSVAG
jgi:hypothetical protein